MYILDNMKTTTIQKWGNSYAVRIPRESVESLNLKEGQAVRIEEENGALSITPAPRSGLSLAKLVAGITPKNLHGEVNWGASVGREAW